jgi:hypothetical protein
MVKATAGARQFERAVRWDDVFEQVNEDSAHCDLDGAVVVGLCSDGMPELFVTGFSEPDEVITALQKLESFILDRCDTDPSGKLQWKAKLESAQAADMTAH